MVGERMEKTEAPKTGLGQGARVAEEGIPSSSTPANGDEPDSGSAIALEDWDPCTEVAGTKRRGWRAWSRAFLPSTNSRNETTLRDLANYDAIRQLVCLNRERFRWVKRMQGHLEGCCNSIKVMSYASFVLGWALILVPLCLFFFSESHDTSLLWFSGIGLAETLAILVYRPIDRVQEATSDMAQGTLIMNSWATEIGLILYLTDLPDLKSHKNDLGKLSGLIDIITGATGEHVEWFQRFTEARNHSENGEKAPDEAGKKDSVNPKAQPPGTAAGPKK